MKPNRRNFLNLGLGVGATLSLEGEGDSSGTSSPVARNARDVRLFGAKGDGRRDDSAAIQAALDASSGGGLVYFPSGDYLITTSLRPSSNTTLVGDGFASTILCSDKG